MESMGLIAWIVIGLIAGWLASKVIPSRLGVVGDTVVGMVGAVIGGLLFTMIGAIGTTGFSIWSVFVAFIGAVILLVVIRAMNNRKTIVP